jgi:hypothetical protein
MFRLRERSVPWLLPVYRLTTWLSHRLWLRCIFDLNIPAPSSNLFSSGQSLSKKGKSHYTFASPFKRRSPDFVFHSSILRFPNQGQAWDDYEFTVHQRRTTAAPRRLIKPSYRREADMSLHVSKNNSTKPHNATTTTTPPHSQAHRNQIQWVGQLDYWPNGYKEQLHGQRL